MTSTTGGITLFTPQNPIIIRMADLYIPLPLPATGTIIPVVGCFVIDVDNNNTVWVVDAVDPTTHASTLSPARMLVSNTNPADSLTSIISYGNDVFRIYYDLRTSPIEVQPDTKLVVFGTDNVSYQLVQNPGPSQTVISRHYDSSGTYTGPLAPMAVVVDSTGTPHPGAAYMLPCNVQVALTDGEEIFIEVFNSEGAQTCLISAFAKQSIIINEAISPSPIITAISILSTQSRSGNEIFIYEGQSIASLGLQVQLTYSDGHLRIVPIDGTQCFLYGTEDFVPSYPGLQQGLIAKYFLELTETMSISLAQLNRNYVTVETNLVVIPNGLQAGVKISVIPQWNITTSSYNLSYFLYSITRDRVINVTSLVTISSGTPYVPTYFGGPQVLTLQLDMSLAEPTLYSVSTIYQQTCIITLQPRIAIDRYTLKDATNAPVTYGLTLPGLPRPVLHYDSTLSQYYVPSAFTSLPIFLQTFFTNANPPYDTTTETQAPTPTHFWLRDPSSGVLLSSAALPVTSFNAAMSIIGAGLANRYAGVGSVILVEFLVQVTPGNYLLLFGVPCDVYPGVYSG
jgi:hypothetical protein